MREAPDPKSKVVSQALFAEKILIEKTQGNFALVQTPDSYTGWIPGISIAKRQTPYKAQSRVTSLMAHLYSDMDIKYGPLMTIPYGVDLQVLVVDERWTQVE